MDTLIPVFDFYVTTLGKYLVMMNSSWYTQIILYLVLLAVVVSVILVVRGSK